MDNKPLGSMFSDEEVDLAIARHASRPPIQSLKLSDRVRKQATEHSGAVQALEWLKRPDSSLDASEKLKVQAEMDKFFHERGLNDDGRCA